MLQISKGSRFTSGCVQSSTASITFEMLCFLVGYENLEVVKVALAVEAPWSFKFLVQIRISLAFLRHLCGRGSGEEGGVLCRRANKAGVEIRPRRR
jgi:hypothetical protein